MPLACCVRIPLLTRPEMRWVTEPTLSPAALLTVGRPVTAGGLFVSADAEEAEEEALTAAVRQPCLSCERCALPALEAAASQVDM